MASLMTKLSPLRKLTRLAAIPLFRNISVSRNSMNDQIVLNQEFHALSLPNISESTFKESIFLEPEEEALFRDVSKHKSVLEELEVLEDVSHVKRIQGYRVFNFAALANSSPILKKLVELGVNFYKIEKSRYIPHYLVRLDKEDIAPHIQFLLNLNLQIDHLGEFITTNPFIFMNDINDLETRVNYLESKKFKPDEITKMVICNPKLLNYSTKLIDYKLGNLQYMLRLSAYQVRQAMVNFSQLINYNKESVRISIFELRDVNQFSFEQCQKMFVQCPDVFYNLTQDMWKLKVEYLLIDMSLSHHLIAEQAEIFKTDYGTMVSRHLFLKALGRAQYDPTKPNYVQLKELFLSEDENFCENIAKTAMRTYNHFLKTL